MLFRLACRVSIEGGEHIPATGGVVFASNHISAFDTLLIPYAVLALQGVQIVWAPAKVELFRRPLVARLLTSLGAFPIRRGRNDMRAMRRMVRLMRTEKMMLFPEGTRSRDGHLQAGNRMAGRLIYQGRPIVIPTAIIGTDRICARARQRHMLRPCVTVRYGKPLNLQHYYALPDTKATAEAIMQEVMGAIASLLYNAPRHTGEASCPTARPHSLRNT
jgi:1-acyl-sn-glycerol-3-phosphate acyltransferase